MGGISGGLAEGAGFRSLRADAGVLRCTQDDEIFCYFLSLERMVLGTDTGKRRFPAGMTTRKRGFPSGVTTRKQVTYANRSFALAKLFSRTIHWKTEDVRR